MKLPVIVACALAVMTASLNAQSARPVVGPVQGADFHTQYIRLGSAVAWLAKPGRL